MVYSPLNFSNFFIIFLLCSRGCGLNETLMEKQMRRVFRFTMQSLSAISGRQVQNLFHADVATLRMTKEGSSAHEYHDLGFRKVRLSQE